MGYRRKLAGLSLSVVLAAAIGVGIAGTASASIIDPDPYQHITGFGNGLCLMADSDTNTVRDYTCENTETEQWSQIPVQEAGATYYMFASRWTTGCMAVPDGHGINGSPVVLKPCDVNDASEYWDTNLLGNSSGHTIYHLQALLGALCLDRPTESDAPGEQMQMWKCQPLPDNWNPFSDVHPEQMVEIVRSID